MGWRGIAPVHSGWQLKPWCDVRPILTVANTSRHARASGFVLQSHVERGSIAVTSGAAADDDAGEGEEQSMSENQDQTASELLKVLIYSSDRLVREQIKLALGRRIAADLPQIEISEFATQPVVIKALEKDSFDVAIFDAEARPGGMGLSHQVKDEIPDAPPVLLLIARAADAWMATWSRADGISPYPVDPIRLPDDVAQVVRNARAGKTTALSAGVVVPGSGSRHNAED